MVAEEREREKVSMEGERKNAVDFLENTKKGMEELKERINEVIIIIIIIIICNYYYYYYYYYYFHFILFYLFLFLFLFF